MTATPGTEQTRGPQEEIIATAASTEQASAEQTGNDQLARAGCGCGCGCG